ncbi:SGNH/GDSL hydrolase family protein [Silanimonas sp.]|jgi:lysophospholipase L1-like esterase|uniref:SGNH/GDSL hydrolase family protein n=1 Tax=Silanimonas sp. TaxID=1929290 RepID=UPI0037C9797C
MNAQALQRFIRATYKDPALPRVYCLGDSWFQLPLKPVDLHKQLRGLFAGDAIFANNAVPGRTTAEIKQQFSALTQHLGALEIDVLLVSMGGNDIAGHELAEYLKRPDEPQNRGHYTAPLPAIVERHVRLATFHSAMNTLEEDFQRVIDIRDKFRRPCKVVLHSYAYPMPNGRRATRLGGIFKAGPWLKPHLVAAGLTALADKKALMRWLVDEFHARLERLAQRNPEVFLVDSRRAVQDSEWSDEIHPTDAGYERIAREYWQPVLMRVFAGL